MSSAGLWLMPFTDGTKIIAVGQMRAIICASWPAPEHLAAGADVLLHTLLELTA